LVKKSAVFFGSIFAVLPKKQSKIENKKSPLTEALLDFCSNHIYNSRNWCKGTIFFYTKLLIFLSKLNYRGLLPDDLKFCPKK
jgi:hypothetical protein